MRKESSYPKNETRLCVKCKERLAYSSGAYCGQCSSRVNMDNLARREKRQRDLAVNLTRVENFLEAISRTALELEVATSNETRRYLRTVIDREVSNLGLMATGLIKAQIK